MYALQCGIVQKKEKMSGTVPFQKLVDEQTPHGRNNRTLSKIEHEQIDAI